MESGFKIPNESRKVAYLIEKGVSGDRLCDIIAKAQEARADGTQVLVARMNKNKKFQKEQLITEGYEEFEEFDNKNIKSSDFAKKLMGQLVFIYFLQKKGWLGVEKDADWGTGPKNFLRKIYDNCVDEGKNF